MIDLHSHILPGLDDGPDEMETSLKMAELYAAAGVRHVVATPHYIPGTNWCPEPEKILSVVEKLNRAIVSARLKLTVHPGMEIAMDERIPEQLDRGELLPLAEGNTLLIETPFQHLPAGLAPLLFEIRAMGFEVMLAHPERCLQIADAPEIAARLANAGVFLQLNGDSFRSGSGAKVQSTARWLLGRGAAACIATDSHGTGSRNPLGAIWIQHHISQWIGEEGLHQLTHGNPAKTLSGVQLPNVRLHQRTGV